MVVATTLFGENVCVYTKWLSKDELAAWVRLVAVIELLPVYSTPSSAALRT